MRHKMEEIKIKGVNETIYYELSNNSLPIYMWKNEKMSNYYITLSTRYGSIHTDYKLNSKNFHMPKGIAHYLEHLKFNEQDGQNANDFFEKNGSSSNAFTTFDYTSYEVFAIDNLRENLNHLLDFVYTPYFTNSLLNKERGIITEEIKMGQDNPYSKLFFEFYNCLFSKLNYRYEIAGTVEDINSITLGDIKKSFEAFYNPENMFLIVTGNFNPYEVIEIVNDNLGKKEFKKIPQVTMLNKKEPALINNIDQVIYDNVEIPKVKIGIKLRKSLFNDIDDVSLFVCTSIILNINFGGTSTFKDYLIENNLVEYISVFREFIGDYLILSLTFDSRVPEEAIKVIKKQLNNLTVSEEELTRRCNANLATMIGDYDNISTINENIQFDLIQYNKINTNLYDIYKQIDLNLINKILKQIKCDEKNTCVLKILPKTN